MIATREFVQWQNSAGATFRAVYMGGHGYWYMVTASAPEGFTSTPQALMFEEIMSAIRPNAETIAALIKLREF